MASPLVVDGAADTGGRMYCLDAPTEAETMSPTMSPRLHLTMHPIVERQLASDRPRGVAEIERKLLALGRSAATPTRDGRHGGP